MYSILNRMVQPVGIEFGDDTPENVRLGWIPKVVLVVGARRVEYPPMAGGLWLRWLTQAERGGDVMMIERGSAICMRADRTVHFGLGAESVSAPYGACAEAFKRLRERAASTQLLAAGD